MGVKLQKKASVSLTKKENVNKKFMIGLGWDPIEKFQQPSVVREVTRKKRGILGLFGAVETVLESIVSPSVDEYDLDAAVYMSPSNGGDGEMVFYNHQRSYDGSVWHLGDNLTGRTGGALVMGNTNDKEQIEIDVSKVDKKFVDIWVGVNIYRALEKIQSFGNIRNAFIRIVDMTTNEEMCRFELDESEYRDCTGVIMGRLYLREGEWNFQAIGSGYRVSNLTELFKKVR